MGDVLLKNLILAVKDISTQLKTINRNINYLGRKIEDTNRILEKQKNKNDAAESEPMLKVSDIDAWNGKFFDTWSVEHNLTEEETKLVFACINRMRDELIKAGKSVD